MAKYTAGVSRGIAIVQDVIADPNNSYVGKLDAGVTWEGSISSTLGVAGIQVSIYADQNCTVYVDQSPDTFPHWDITDQFLHIASRGGSGWTIQAVSSYVRVRVTNTSGANTSVLRLQTALCPIVEAVPRALDRHGRLKTVAGLEDTYGFEVENTPFNEIRTSDVIKLAGSIFIGTTVDTNFWTITPTNGGTATQEARTGTTGGELLLQTAGAANGAVSVNSVRRGRFSAGHSNLAKMLIYVPDTGLTNNKRRWGIADSSALPTIIDGAYFQIDGTTFSVATMRGGTEALVSSGSFNGNLGSTRTLDTNRHIYEIYYTLSRVWFVVDGELLHTVIAATTPWVNTPTMYIWLDNVNRNNLATNRILYCGAANIHRFGPLVNAPAWKYILKYGAGRLHSVILNTPTKETISIYDDVTAVVANLIAIITPVETAPPAAIPYNLEFYNGLTIVTAGSPNLTVVYE
jgi:hypothetical protein